MTVAGLPAVLSRIAEIQQRFVPPARFAAALAEATAATAAPARPGPAPAPVWQPPAPSSAAGVGAAGGGPVVSAPSAGAPEWAARLPEAGRQWAPAIADAADRAGVDPRLLAALVWAESGFRADARSHAGATGLTQLMPGTARGLGVDPHDPASNLLGGARYLRAQLDRFGSPALALAAYNAGPGRVAQAGGIPRIAETQAYVPRVLDYYARLR
ncbi:MAG TPA: lytic transglycosylase domain-containing protein [Egibacteraceae bacterium]|nr:lytic transglycosylase domain-containing protein [Egibacteraceae bacterium]